MVGAIVLLTACGDDDDNKDNEQKDAGPSPPAGGVIQTFEPAANDLSLFSEPRDAVPLDNGTIAFIARAKGNVTVDPDNASQEGAQSQLADHFGVFVMEAGAKPHLLYKDLVAPFNIASNGKDTIYVADIGGGTDGKGVILQLAVANGNPMPLAAGYRPQGVATDKDGKIFFSGRDPVSGDVGVFSLDGATAKPISTGGAFRSPSGLDIDDDGTIYMADPTAALGLEDNQVTGSGHGVVFKIADGKASVFTAGFNAGYPTGIAIAGKKLIVSSYAERGANSAVLIFDILTPDKPTIFVDKITDVFTSAGLHRSRATGTLTWSGGNTVYVINKK